MTTEERSERRDFSGWRQRTGMWKMVLSEWWHPLEAEKVKGTDFLS